MLSVSIKFTVPACCVKEPVRIHCIQTDVVEEEVMHWIRTSVTVTMLSLAFDVQLVRILCLLSFSAVLCYPQFTPLYFYLYLSL